MSIMSIQIRPRDRRALTGLLAAVALYAVFSYGVFPAYDRLALAGAAAAEKEDQLGRYRRAVLRSGQYAELEEQARRQIEQMERRLVPSDNPSQAAAELQSMVVNAAEEIGIVVTQRSPQPVRRLDDFYSEVPMAMTFNCTPSQLVQLLARLRDSEQFLNLKAVQLAPLQIVHQAPVEGGIPKTLRVSITVAGLTRNAEVEN